MFSKKSIVRIMSLSLCGFACSENFLPENKSTAVKEDLKKGEIIVLTNNSPYSYFEYRDELMGFEYEILDAFSKSTGMPLKYKVVQSEKDQTTFLKEKKGDLIASNISLNLLEDAISFSIPYDKTSLVLVRRKSKEDFSLDSLEGKIIHVPKNSNFQLQLEYLKAQTSLNFVIQADSDLNVEDLMELVQNKEIDYTVAYENLIHMKAFDAEFFDCSVKLSFPHKIGFALRSSSEELKNKIDSFLTSFLSSKSYTNLEKKYFENSYLNPPVNFISTKRNITPYDDLFKKAVKNSVWDWMLVAALVQKESNFNPQAIGMGGSFGVAQLMPFIGEKYGVDINSSVESQLAVAVKILNNHLANWENIPDMTQRTKFALASYNAGLGHIIDAKNLAETLGLNPLKWDDNVEFALMKLHSSQYYKNPIIKCGAYFGHADYYVQRIFDIYVGYKEF